LLTTLSKGYIWPLGKDNLERKIKYWEILDNYVLYQDKFPREIIYKRRLTCWINEGRQPEDMEIRKERNIPLKR
jgi:hypothetical protein